MRIARAERTVACIIMPNDVQELDAVEEPGAPAWDDPLRRRLRRRSAFVFEAVTDPNVPPLPPHISLEQAKAFTSTVLKRNVDALGFLKQTMKQVTARFTTPPHSGR